MKDSFAGQMMLSWQFFQHLEYVISLLSILWFFKKSQKLILLQFSCMWQVIFFAFFKNFSLSFSSFTVMCQIMDFFMVVLGVYWPFEICILTLFIKFEMFSAILSLSIFFWSLLSSPSSILIMHMLVCFIIFHTSLRYC